VLLVKKLHENKKTILVCLLTQADACANKGGSRGLAITFKNRVVFFLNNCSPDIKKLLYL
jgi:hypothetical protein